MELYAVRYAQSLFDLAIELNNLSSFNQAIQTVNDLFNTQKEGFQFLTHDNVPKLAKKELLVKLFPDLNSHVFNFLQLLIDRNRIKSFKDIYLSFRSLSNHYLGVEEGIVYSTQSLDSEEVKRIEEAVSKKMKVKVELINRIDTTILAGIKVVVGDTVFDDTLSYRLNEMKTEILKGKR